MVEFGKEADLPALDLEWEDNIAEEEDIAEVAGGEQRIIDAVAERERARVMIENTASIIGEIHDILIEALHRDLPNLPHAYLHFCAWQSVRDFRTAMYLAMSGRYRHATIIHRSALEVTAHGVYFEVEGPGDGEEVFEAWQQGKKGDAPNTTDLKKALQELDGPSEPDLGELYGRRHGKLSTMSHSYIGGDIERVLEGEEEEPPLHAWSAYFSMEDLVAWYEEFVHDSYFIYYVLGQFWDFGEFDDVQGITLHLFNQISEGVVRGSDGDVEFRLDAYREEIDI